MLLSLACGVAFHLATISYELDFWVLRLALAQVAAFCGYVAFQVIGTQVSASVAARHALALGTSFQFGLWTSVILYRLFFHRLHSFPGPRLAKLSRFYVTWTSSRKVQQHLETDKLHTKYGDFVRIGMSLMFATITCRAADHPTRTS
jgi:hypothetical protein